jgi:hypothetical protein
MSFWNYSNMQEYQQAAKRRRMNRVKRARKLKRNPAPVEAKPGTRPLSKMSDLHPVRRYEPGDPRRDNYNRRLFV